MNFNIFVTVLLFLLFVAAVPVLLIFSINTLFPALGIVLTPQTWLAALILIFLFAIRR